MVWLPQVAGHIPAAPGVAPGPARRWQQRHRLGPGQGGTPGRLDDAVESANVLSARVGFSPWLLTTWGTPMAFVAISPSVYAHHHGRTLLRLTAPGYPPLPSSLVSTGYWDSQ